jgi:hypothetical protein
MCCISPSIRGGGAINDPCAAARHPLVAGMALLLLAGLAIAIDRTSRGSAPGADLLWRPFPWRWGIGRPARASWKPRSRYSLGSMIM